MSMHKINGAVTVKGPDHIVVRSSPSTSSASCVSSEKTKSDPGTQRPQKLKLRPVKSDSTGSNINIPMGSSAWQDWFQVKAKEAARRKEKQKIKEDKDREEKELEKEKKAKQLEEQKLNFQAWMERKRKQDEEERKKLTEKLEINKQVLTICTKVKDSLSRERVRAWVEQKNREDQIKREREMEVEREKQKINNKQEEIRVQRNASAWADWAKRAKTRPKTNNTLLKPIVYNPRQFEKKLRDSGVWVNPEPWCSSFSGNEEDSESEYYNIDYPIPKTAPLASHNSRNPIRGVTT